VSIGDALAEARSRAGLTITQVSQRTCIRETIIRGIERGDFSACGGDFYARGHIRSIARAVGADPDELIREYDVAHGSPQAIRAADVFEPATPIKLKERRSPNWSVAMVLVLAGVLGFGVYRAVAPRHHAPPAGRTTAQSGSSSPKPAPAASRSAPATAPAATGGLRRHHVVIRLTAIQDCWVEFTKPDGTYLNQSYITGGSTKTWTFRHAVDMQIGNPGGILLTVNGRDLGRPGSPGQPLTLTLGPGKKVPGQGG
jgi:cytoskeletal protein RodZ